MRWPASIASFSKTGPPTAPTRAVVGGVLIVPCGPSRSGWPVPTASGHQPRDAPWTPGSRPPSLPPRPARTSPSCPVRSATTACWPADRGYYSIKIAASVAALGAVVLAAVLVGNSWWVLLVAAVLAFVLTQLGFIGHDAGHRQICGADGATIVIGLMVADLFVGLQLRLVAEQAQPSPCPHQSPRQGPRPGARGLGLHAGPGRGRGWFGRGFARSQILRCCPCCSSRPLNLHVASVHSLARRRDRRRWSRVGLLALHTLLFFVAPFLVPLPAAGPGVHRRHPGPVRLLPGGEFHHQPRRDAHAVRYRRVGIPAPSGAHVPQPVGPLLHRLPLRRARHPDRAPSLPVHAPGQPAPGPGAGAPLLRRAPDRLRRAESVAGLSRGAGPPPSGRQPARPSPSSTESASERAGRGRAQGGVEPDPPGRPGRGRVDPRGHEPGSAPPGRVRLQHQAAPRGSRSKSGAGPQPWVAGGDTRHEPGYRWAVR